MVFKTFIKTLALCLVPGMFFGQSIKNININMGSRMNLDGLIRRVETNPPGTLVLLDSQDRAWEAEFSRIRREDPFATINLQFIPLVIGQGAGEELREREGWQRESPHWAIFNAFGRIVADGANIPTSVQLADACASANIIGKVEMYRRFLREHPDHEEARGAMLREMIAIAEIRTRNALQVPETSTKSTITTVFSGGARVDNGEDGPTDEQVATLQELTSDADERIWRDYCIELQRHLEGTLWQAGTRESRVGFMSIKTNIQTGSKITTAWAVFSPLVRSAYRRAASKVERALECQPASWVLWDIWVTLHKTGAGTPMKDLLARLEPSPTTTAANWPPQSVRTAYIKVCREAGDWKAIQDFVEPIWEEFVSSSQSINRLRQQLQNQLLRDINLNFGSFNQGFWTSDCEAYLEALLRQGQLRDAERMMNTWGSNSGWPGAFLSAAIIAEKMGYDSAAKAWRAEGEKNYSERT